MKDLLYYQAVLPRLFPRFSLIFVDVTPRKPTNTSVRFDIYACQVGVKDGNYVVRMELPLTEVLYLKASKRR